MIVELSGTKKQIKCQPIERCSRRYPDFSGVDFFRDKMVVKLISERF